MANEVVLLQPGLLARAQGRSLGRWLLTGAVLGWFALMILVPAVALVSRALRGGLGPFLAALATPEAIRAFALTLRITAIGTVFNTVLGVAFALVLVRHRFWGQSLADGLVDLPFAVSPVVAGLILIVLYGPEGLLGRWIQPLGIHVVYALPGMVLACLFVTLPFVVREVVPVLRELGDEQEQAASTLGAGRWTTFWRVTLPSIRWGVAYGVTLTVARSVGEFGALLVVSGNILGRTQTATLYVHDAIESFRPEGAYAASVVLAGLSFLFLIVMEATRRHMAAREGRS
jgi:sulfate/thiosulfate transport system permease protein